MATVSWKVGISSRLLVRNLTNSVKVSRNVVRRNYSLQSSFTRNCSAAPYRFNTRYYATETSGDRTSILKQLEDDQKKSSILKQLEEEQKKDEEEAKKHREQNWRNTKRGLIACGGMITISFGYMIFSFGATPTDAEGNPIKDEFSDLPFPQQHIYRIFKELDYVKKLFGEPSRQKLLPDPLTYPYIQPPYTLVLEFTDMLVHPDWTYQTGWRFKKRPGVDYFLEQVAPPLFEVVVYTAESGMTVFPILDALDPNGYIMYRLVRDATNFVDGHHVKSLDHLNRDLSKVIVVDWNSSSVKMHPRNTLLIPRWNGNDSDRTLIDLAAFLKMLATNKVEDVRDVLDYYQQFEDPLQAFRDNQRRVLENLEQTEKERKDGQQGLAQRWRPSFLKKT
ncbi:mitochondrial import inner membrane translocase subunit TIM50-C-like isoform X1 [Thrips palmi]|uniref:Mitochondrial import inner membrane translocase subunit TIM50 n=2 Tax=Thrips palmi TaxID=161013 RepID=A0A6P8YUL2_THRPL|nr:mitochondrial import inner membrane translocase subunit TIM50-C-like isoform X1 [Thrips palmi]